jgi:tRNA dimethylallyltransferase
MKPRPLLVITGPTASGKSALAVGLCERLGGEIVSCDSMQIYRGCDIATAKPTPQERAEIPHHLLDICDPDERYSAAQWAARARDVIDEVESRGKIPIVCGGTGFYLRALTAPQVLSEVEPDRDLRERLEQELKSVGAAQMHEKLARLDTAAAARLHPNDSFRVLRAIEVALVKAATPESTVETIPASEFEPHIFGIDWPREVLYGRINSRVDAMIEVGFPDELQRLVAQWGRDAAALGGVGYKQMMPTLDDATLWDECLGLWKQDTRRYAKRQMTWFRHQLGVTWFDGEMGVQKMVETIAEKMAGSFPTTRR